MKLKDKLHAFFVALEYLNICEFTVAAGPLKYLSELEEWRHENRGLALLLTVDTLIRKKVHRLNHDRRKEFSTFSKALVEVLTNHKQIWNDARSSAELDKFKQAGHQDPATPVRSAKRSRSLSDNEESPTKPSPIRRTGIKLGENARRLCSPRPRPLYGALLPRSPLVMTGSRRRSGKCGCRFGDGCRNAHACVECGASHPYHGNH